MRINLLQDIGGHATPTADDRPLAVAVEQVVRSLPFSQGRKARIRDDLFSHLKSIHEEEAAKGGTDDEIVARSLARFGDPGEISIELRSGIIWSQTLVWRIGQAFEFRVTDSAEQFCFRFFAHVATMMAALSLVIWLVKCLSGEANPWHEVGLLALAFGMISLLVTAILYFGIKFAETVVFQKPRQVLLFFFIAAPVRMKVVIDSSPRFFVVVWLSLLLAVYPAMYFFSSYLYGEWYLLSHPHWLFLALTALGSAIVGLIAGFAFMLDRRYRLSWETLSIFSESNFPKESTA